MLPSLARLEEEYGVSRLTVREAIVYLSKAGLLRTAEGRGYLVLSPSPPATVISRTVTRTGRTPADRTYALPPDLAHPSEPPAVSRTTITGADADLLGIDPTAESWAFRIDRLLIDAPSRARAQHRMIIPFDTAADFPGPELETPATDPAILCTALARAGQTLTWWETVTARTALPDDHATFRTAADDGPLLITTRITYGTRNRPLLLETLTMPAAQAQFGYRITPTSHGRPGA
jgi:GntR family transcriptional regulator